VQPVVSVVVPAYNVAPYIGRCIDSLLAQTVPIEIIVVNDGSTDSTSETVRAIRTDGMHSIVLLEQSNRGLSASRNVGLRRASGEFVGLVDGDDWVEPEMYSILVAASRPGADLTICNGEMVDHHTQATKPFHDDQRFSTLARETSGPFDPRTVPDVFRLDTSACKRLYRRLWLQELGFHFGEGLLFEDILAHYQLLVAGGQLLLVDRKFYKYRINHPGRITDRRDERVLTVFEVLTMSGEALASQRVSSKVWANFIWFQSWVLQWLASQIETAHQDRFLNGVVQLGRQFPVRGIREFHRTFGEDDQAQITVALQLFGCKDSFLRRATNALTARDRQIVSRAHRFRDVSALLGRVF
jgi:glycosyltransferase involved in cell wall biosynthesis